MDSQRCAALAAAVTAANSVINVLLASSSSSSESEEENISTTFAYSSVFGMHEVHPKLGGYVSVIRQYSDADFWSHFRMSRSTFSKLSDFFRQFESKVYSGGNFPIPLEEVLYVAIYYLANMCSVRIVAELFGRSRSAVWFAVDTVCQILTEEENQFISWPKPSEYPSIAGTFQARSGFPGTVACLDGCHIPISPPNEHQKGYLNYKKFHSVVLMAMALPDRRFCFTCIGFPGSNNDAYVFKRTEWWNTYLTDRSQYFPRGTEDYHIVADSAFPLNEHILVPFKRGPNSNVPPPQKRFNKKLSSARVTIEQTFGELVNRFQRCQDVKAKSIQKSVKIITACCVLHNLCIENGDLFRESFTVQPHLNVNPVTDATLPSLSQSGSQKRSRILSVVQ